MGWFSRMRVRVGAGGGEVLRLHDDLEGMLAVRESAWLYRAARGGHEIVEIGSYRGKSCVLLAKGCQSAGGRVTAIDPNIVRRDNPRLEFDGEDRRTLLAAIERHGVKDRVNELVMTSRDAISRWDGCPIDLLWVDGDHSEAEARFDIEKWGAFVRPGGIMAAHDYGRFPGVNAAWDRLATRKRGWEAGAPVRTIVWATRR
jgi:predicted O-methyltransferase YrrM